MTADRPTDQRATPSPFAGLPRGQTINELRMVHAEIVDLASSSSKLGSFRDRRRLRAARRREADLLHRLGFSSYAAFTVAFPDARDPEPRAPAQPPRVLTPSPPPVASGAGREPERERTPPPEPSQASEPPPAPAPEPQSQRAPTVAVPSARADDERPGGISLDDAAAHDEIDVREERETRPDEAPAPAVAAAIASNAPIPTHWHPVSTAPPEVPEPIVHEVTTPRLETTSDVAMLRNDLAELLTELTSAIKGATAEIRALGELARDQRLDLEQRRVGADAEARRVLEVAEAEATVLRLEAFAAARRIRGQIGTELPPEPIAAEPPRERIAPPVPPKSSVAAGAAAAIAATPPPPQTDSMPPRAPAPEPPAAEPPERSQIATAETAIVEPPIAEPPIAEPPIVDPAVVAPAVTAPVPATAAPDRTSAQPGRRQRKRRKRRVRTAFVIALAAAVLLGGLVAVAYAMRDNGSSHSDRSTNNTTPPPTAAQRAAVPAGGTVAKSHASATVSSTAKASKPAAHPGTPPSPSATDAADLARENAYAGAYKAECLKLWSHAGSDGLLWDPDNLDGGGHRVSECLQPLDATLGSTYTSEADATAAGTSDADSAAAELTVGNRLQPSGGGGAFNIP